MSGTTPEDGKDAVITLLLSLMDYSSQLEEQIKLERMLEDSILDILASSSWETALQMKFNSPDFANWCRNYSKILTSSGLSGIAMWDKLNALAKSYINK